MSEKSTICKARRCPDCDRPRQFSFRHDAHYCPYCEKWLEPGCADPLCIFCAQRPEKPPKP